MTMDQYLNGFIKENSPSPYNKTYLKNLLISDKDYSFSQMDYYADIELLDETIMHSVQALPRAKDSAIKVYRSFVKYLQRQGEDVEVEFPPVPIDSSFERQMYIAKYLQKKDATILDLQDVLWVSDRTIEKDLQRLRKESADPISICGRQFFIPGTNRDKSKVTFSSTLHPIFLTENLTQVIIMLEGLKHMAENPNYQRYAETTAANIWEQLSDYAKDRIRKVIGPILPGDLNWYESLERDSENTFRTESDCSVPGNVFVEAVKSNGKREFCIEYELDGNTVIYEKCFLVPGSYSKTADGKSTFEIDCSKGRVTLEEQFIRRSAFEIEELL